MERALRRHYAAGDYVTRFPAGSPHELLIESPVEKPGWQARTDAGITAPEFPGTAISFENCYFEIIRIESAGSASQQRYRYYLNPWEDRFPLRTQFAYTPQECRRILAATRRQKQDSSILMLLNALAPLVGMLPGSDQLRMQNTYGLQALRTTTISLFTTLAAGGALLILGGVSVLDPHALDNIPVLRAFSPMVLAFAGALWVIESILRMFSIKHDEPMGSFPVSFPLEAVRAIRKQFDPVYRQKQFEALESRNPSVFLNARDEVRVVSETDLEIISILPKPDWGPLTGIQYQENWYGCIESRKTGMPPEVRYAFLIRRAPAGTAFRTAARYSPDEVRHRYIQKRRQDLGTWVETFGPFLGLLNTADQKRLQELYGFNALKFTLHTIVVIGAISAINVVVSLMNMGANSGSPADVVWLLAAGYFLLESGVRLRDWMKQEPVGSILALLLRPFCERLLRGN